MKYVLYRFPNAVRHPENSDPELYGIFKFPVKGQVVGVEFGSSIGAVSYTHLTLPTNSLV